MSSSLFLEETVEAWLGRNGYFTIRGIKIGNPDIGILAIKPHDGAFECRHIEVQLAFDPLSYFTRDYTKRLTNSEIREEVNEWVFKKFDHPQTQDLRQNLCDQKWSRELVSGEEEYEEVVQAFKQKGIKIIPLLTVLKEMTGKLTEERLFFAQVVGCNEDLWFAPGTDGPPIKTTRMYTIDQMLFVANDEHHAYDMVNDWLVNECFSDLNHDGPGDITQIFAIGIHELEEITWLGDFSSALHERYGVTLPPFCLADIEESGIPKVREKEELKIFRLLRLREKLS